GRRNSQQEGNIELLGILPCDRAGEAEPFRNESSHLSFDPLGQKVINVTRKVVEGRTLLPETRYRREDPLFQAGRFCADFIEVRSLNVGSASHGRCLQLVSLAEIEKA